MPPAPTAGPAGLQGGAFQVTGSGDLSTAISIPREEAWGRREPQGPHQRPCDFNIEASGPLRHTARMNYLVAVLIGLVGGLTSGLFGVGGGIIMVPAMALLMHTDMKTAVATSLAVIVPTTLASSVLNQSFGRIDWRLVAALAVPAIIGGLASTWFKEQIPSETLKKVFGGFLLLVGARLLLWK